MNTSPTGILSRAVVCLRSPAAIWWWIVVIVAGNLLELGFRVDRFPNIDEVAHLPAGISHWKFERFDMYRVNPPLVRTVATIPNYLANTSYSWNLYDSSVGSRPEFTIGRNKLDQVKINHWKDFVYARLVALSFMILLSVVLMRWLGKLLGPYALVCLCTWLWFCPNLKANAPTILPDVGAVATGVLACYMFWLYWKTPSWEQVVACGVGLGFALLSKLTWLSAILSLPATLCLCLLLFRESRSKRSVAMTARHVFCILVLALAVVHVGYLFEDSVVPLRQYEFVSQVLGGTEATMANPGNRFKEGWLGMLPIPVPKNFILGIDHLKMEVEQKYWSFLLGEWKFGSWPHYYLMTTLFKTPEPTLLAAALGLGVLIVGTWRKMVAPEVISMFLFLVIPPLVAFASVSWQGGFNHHHRYVLMIYPPMFALAAYVASPVAVQLLRFRLPFLGPERRSIAIPLALTLAVLSAASSLRVHPYYTSYFNTLSGGPEYGWHLLGFSNIDWGQDILEVDAWLKAHPDRRPLVMDLDYSNANVNLFDVPTSMPPKLPKGESVDEVRRSITETQWWIISVKKLYNFPDRPGLEYLQQIQPVERIAYAYHVYRIDPLPADPGAADPKGEPRTEESESGIAKTMEE
ncbi:MAG: ArnT family glycosyltransferase [Planctomycetota bacterium]